MTADQTVPGVALVAQNVAAELAHSLKQTPEDIDPDLPFADMGVDSLILMEALQEINRRYRVALTVGDIYENINTVAKVARHIHEHGAWREAPAGVAPADAREQTSSADTELPAFVERAEGVHEPGVLEQIVRQQLELMERQLSLLTAGTSSGPKQKAVKPRIEAGRESARAAAMEPDPRPETAADDRFSAFSIRLGNDARERDPEKTSHIAELSARFNRKTSQSKHLVQQYRRVLADNRASAGFRPVLKEMVYPILAEQAHGARLVDIDGNEYIDFTMGFGVYLFGHAPDFVMKCIREQLERGMPIGPQSPMAGRTAALVCELTGHERVMYCNSGTEATMTAVRLARARTGRERVVIFKNSYHGTFDGFLARATAAGTSPASLGTSRSAVQDTVVLDYCEAGALDYIGRHAQEIAAVLVEPVQSRAPAMRPREFLAELRRLTQSHEVALIFDEIISGFRCAPGGAQEYFGVKADICTYGKIVGGGMPIGLVAGSASYLDAVDGGWWQYGDNSYPSVPTIFFAGTFSKHPLALAASIAVLEHIKSADGGMYQRLNDDTARLAERLNAVLDEEGVDIQVEAFASLFRFASKGNIDLLFYHLLDAGIYIWEGRNCFISTAHTAQDFDRFVTAVKNVCRELARLRAVPLKAGVKVADREAFALADAQQRFRRLEAGGPDGSTACNICYGVRFDAPIDTDRLAKAATTVMSAQGALWYRIDVGAGTQRRAPVPERIVDIVRLPQVPTDVDCERLLEEQQGRRFELSSGVNARAHVYVFEDSTALLGLCAHHLVCDGWGLTVLLQRIAACYNGDSIASAADGVPYARWIGHEAQYRNSEQYLEDRAFWHRAIEPIAVSRENADAKAPRSDEIRARKGARATLVLDESLTACMRARAKADGVTPFTWLLCNFLVFLNRIHRNRPPIVGIPVANRATHELGQIVGTCVNLLPLRPCSDSSIRFEQALAFTRQAMSASLRHSQFSYHEMCAHYQTLCGRDDVGPVTVTFNVEPITEVPRFGDVAPTLIASPNGRIEFDLMFNLFLLNDSVRIELDYDPDLFVEDMIYGWLNLYAKTVEVNAAASNAVSAAPAEAAASLDA